MTDWEQLYQNNDTGWDRGQPSPVLHTWIAQLQAQHSQRILIPGCGHGHEVIALAQQGFDVTGLDIAPSAITTLKQHLKQVGAQAHAVCADLFSYQVTQPFDAIYEQTCLCAITPEQRKNYERNLSRWLKKGGLLMLLIMQSGEPNGPPFHCDLLEMKKLFDESRWTWPNTPPSLIPRPKGARFELGFLLKKK